MKRIIKLAALLLAPLAFFVTPTAAEAHPTKTLTISTISTITPNHSVTFTITRDDSPALSPDVELIFTGTATKNVDYFMYVDGIQSPVSDTWSTSFSEDEITSTLTIWVSADATLGDTIVAEISTTSRDWTVSTSTATVTIVAPHPHCPVNRR